MVWLAGVLAGLTSGVACGYEQSWAGFNSGGGALASAGYGGFGSLGQQPLGETNSATYALSAGFLAGDPLSASAPGAPTLLRLVPGNGSMRAVFAAPASNGGAGIAGYRVTCTPSSGPAAHQDGPTSPIKVTGLTNGIGYSCGVTATNSAGTSVASASLAKVVRPVSIAPLLTIILDN